MPDFLLELLSEEIPYRMQWFASEEIKDDVSDLLEEVGLDHHDVVGHVTPRRVAIMATAVQAISRPFFEEKRGPRVDAPEAAVAGFLRSTGLARDQLEERETDKGRFLFAQIRRPGRPAIELLAERLPRLIRRFEWPKSMRWEESGLRWVRPLRGIVALLDREVVPFAVAGIASGRETQGHRLMGQGPIALGSAGDYADAMRAAMVVVDAGERAAMIREGAAKAAASAGLELLADEGLEAENAGLTEWSVPLLGRFDPAFLEVPPEIIQLTMKVNQKYFAVANPDGSLAPAFVCVANLDAPDGGRTIVAGNERVLSARLSDARFFWEQDKKKSLEQHAEGLAGIVFHEKLGTMAEKVERVAKLARWLVETYPDQFPEADADTVERAARLARADLTTGTVGEFPELQGVIGGHLAEAEGQNPGVVSALQQFYAPVPEGSVAVAVALADRLDTLLGSFALGLKPTGSRDPYALRRAGISLINMIQASFVRLPLVALLEQSADYWSDSLNAYWEKLPLADFWDAVGKDQNYRLEEVSGILMLFYGQQLIGPLGESQTEQQRLMDRLMASLVSEQDAVISFLVERLKVQQREAGIRPDVIDAVFANRGQDDLVRLLNLAKALQGFVETDEGMNLLAGYRRAANILRVEEKKDGQDYGGGLSNIVSMYIGETEKNLARLFAPSGGDSGILLFDEIDDLLGREDFEGAMLTLASLRAPVDAFFEQVVVNDPDPAVRVRRLRLLAGVRAAMHKVADFSKIQTHEDQKG